MANIKDNKKGFKVIQISRKELVEELGMVSSRYLLSGRCKGRKQKF